ncbi:MAG: DUF72 domain-containing protein [Flavipsychrobacter sp.]|nr:DUF72 domain-containing protein [Flavipsychrobacter sp.]
MTGKVRIGISGWSYFDWLGIFYPYNTRSPDWLAIYAQSFDTTEINSSFYRLPRVKTVQNWVKQVPEGFKFCPKISKYLTHVQKLKGPEDALEKFFGVFSHIKEHLGPVLVQLPPSLAFEEDIVRHFFEVLKKKYADYEIALEARHESWLAAGAMELLREYNIAWVISQSGVGFPYAEQVTAHVVYLRFHGPEVLYQSRYSDELMVYYGEEIRTWLQAGHDVWVYFNNCYYGNAIDNARTLLHLTQP